jgi:hypothetical protein
MTEPEQSKTRSWLPLTPRGVAAFARSSWWRLLLVQFIFASIVAAATVWFLDTAWFPTFQNAIRQLPPRGEISSGRLTGFTNTPQLLAEGQFLALALDLNHSGQIRSPAHVQFEFGRNDVRAISLFGYAACNYPVNENIAFNRAGLEPWWGAWRPPILWLTFAAVIIWLLVLWPVLAAIYSWPVWLIGFLANRDLDWRGSWKLAGASLLPGALLAASSLVIYGLGWFDLVQLTAVQVGHVVVGWIYAGISPLFLPRHPKTGRWRKNPFAPSGK